jgi:membrane fusion protein
MLSSQQMLEWRDNSSSSRRVKANYLQQQMKSAEQRLQLAETGRAGHIRHERYKLAGTHYVSDIEYQQKQIEVSTAQQNVEDQRQGFCSYARMKPEDDLNHLIVRKS